MFVALILMTIAPPQDEFREKITTTQEEIKAYIMLEKKKKSSYKKIYAKKKKNYKFIVPTIKITHEKPKKTSIYKRNLNSSLLYYNSSTHNK